MSGVIPNTCKECLYVCKSLFFADHMDYPILFRTYVSRKARGKGRTVLEGVGLYTTTIESCFSANPNNEEVVQDGLTRWCGGQGTQPPTWGVLLEAMEYAEIAQQHIQGLKESLGLSGMLVLVCTHSVAIGGLINFRCFGSTLVCFDMFLCFVVSQY